MNLGTIIIGLLVVLKLVGLVYVIIGTMKKKGISKSFIFRKFGVNL
jgi:hypothetical protein